MADPAAPSDIVLARRARFVDEYVKDFNCTAAYLRAFPHVVNRNTARAAGARMRKLCADAIEERTRGMLTAADITIDRVLMELGRLAFYDPRKIVRAIEPTIAQASLVPGRAMPREEAVPLTQLDEDTARAVSEVEVTRRGVRVKLANKEVALQALARLLSPAPNTRNPLSPVQAGANKVDHETLDEGEIEAIISEVIEDEASEDDVVDMDEDGEMLGDEDL